MRRTLFFYENYKLSQNLCRHENLDSRFRGNDVPGSPLCHARAGGHLGVGFWDEFYKD